MSAMLALGCMMFALGCIAGALLLAVAQRFKSDLRQYAEHIRRER